MYLVTFSVFCGHGFTFTIGQGTEVVVTAVKAMAAIVEGVEGGEGKTGIFRRTPMHNRANKPCMEVENN